MKNIDNWVQIFSTNDELEAKLAEDVLKQHEIESHIATHVDSTFPSLGEARLFTIPEKAQEAVQILIEKGIKKEE